MKFKFSGWREMAEKKYVVPEGMLSEAYRVWQTWPAAPELSTILVAAFKWLAENPIVPTSEQAQAIFLKAYSSGDSVREIYSAGEESGLSLELTTAIKINMAVEWQRRMFLAPEPQHRHPPEIERLIRESVSPIHEKTIIEAYEIGLKIGSMDGRNE